MHGKLLGSYLLAVGFCFGQNEIISDNPAYKERFFDYNIYEEHTEGEVTVNGEKCIK